MNHISNPSNFQPSVANNNHVSDEKPGDQFNDLLAKKHSGDGSAAGRPNKQSGAATGDQAVHGREGRDGPNNGHSGGHGGEAQQDNSNGGGSGQLGSGQSGSGQSNSNNSGHSKFAWRGPVEFTGDPSVESKRGNKRLHEKGKTGKTSVVDAVLNSQIDRNITKSMSTLRDAFGSLTDEKNERKARESRRELRNIFSGKKGGLSVLRQLAKGNAEPKIIVVEDSALKGGKGAYSSQDNTIYIARSVAGKGGKELTRVLAEEIGHYIDNKLADGKNGSDAIGDEGALFANFVLKLGLSKKEIAAARKENDHGTIETNHQITVVEFSNGSTNPTFNTDAAEAAYVRADSIGPDPSPQHAYKSVFVKTVTAAGPQGGAISYHLDQASKDLGFRITTGGDIHFRGAPNNLRNGHNVTVTATAADQSTETATFGVSIDAVPTIGAEPLNVSVPEPAIGKNEPILIGKYFDREQTPGNSVQYTLDDASLDKGFYVTEQGWVYFKGAASAIGSGTNVELTLNDKHNSPVSVTIRVTKNNWFNSSFPDTLYWDPSAQRKRYLSVEGSDPSVTYSLETSTSQYDQAAGRYTQSGFKLTRSNFLEYQNNNNDYYTDEPQYLTIVATKNGVISRLTVRLQANRKPHFYRAYIDNPVKPLLNTELLTSSSSSVSIGRLRAVDPDGDALTFTLSGPAGFSINSSTGEITYTGDGNGLPATVSLIVTASDGSESTSRNFIVNVGPPLKLTTEGWSLGKLADALGHRNHYGYSELFSIETNKRDGQEVKFGIEGKNLSDTWKNNYELWVNQSTGKVEFRVKSGSSTPDVSELILLTAERGNNIEAVRSGKEVVKEYYQISIKDGALHIIKVPNVLTSSVLRYKVSAGGKQAIGSLVGIEGGAVTLKNPPAGYSISNNILYFDPSVNGAVAPGDDNPTLELQQNGRLIARIKVTEGIESTIVNSAVPEPNDDTSVVEVRLVGKGASDKSSSAPRYNVRINGVVVSSGVVPNTNSETLGSRTDEDYRSIAISLPKDIDIKEISIELINPDGSSSKGIAVSDVRMNGYSINAAGGKFTDATGAEQTAGITRTTDNGVEITGGGVYGLSSIEAKMKYAKEFLLVPGETYTNIYENLARQFDKTGPELNSIISQLDPEIAVKYLQRSTDIYKPELISSNVITPVTADDIRAIQSGSARKSFDDLKAVAALSLLNDDLSTFAGLPEKAVSQKLIEHYDKTVAGDDAEVTQDLRALHFNLWATENDLDPSTMRAQTLYREMLSAINTMMKKSVELPKLKTRSELSKEMDLDMTLGPTNGLDTAYAEQFTNYKNAYDQYILPGLEWKTVLDGNVSANDLKPVGGSPKTWGFLLLSNHQIQNLVTNNEGAYRNADGRQTEYAGAAQMRRDIAWLSGLLSDVWGADNINKLFLQKLPRGRFQLVTTTHVLSEFQRSSKDHATTWTAQELTEMFTTIFQLDDKLKTPGTAENTRFINALKRSKDIYALNSATDPLDYGISRTSSSTHSTTTWNYGRRNVNVTTQNTGFPQAGGYNFNTLIDVLNLDPPTNSSASSPAAAGIDQAHMHRSLRELQASNYGETDGQIALSVLVPFYQIAINKGMGHDLNAAGIAFEAVTLLLAFIPGVGAATKGAQIGAGLAKTLGKVAARLGINSGSLAGKLLSGLSRAITKTPNVVKALIRELADAAFPVFSAADLVRFGGKTIVSTGRKLAAAGTRLSIRFGDNIINVAKRLGPDTILDRGLFSVGQTPRKLSLTRHGNDNYRWFDTPGGTGSWKKIDTPSVDEIDAISYRDRTGSNAIDVAGPSLPSGGNAEFTAGISFNQPKTKVEIRESALTAVDGKPGLYTVDNSADVIPAGGTTSLSSSQKPQHVIKVGDEYFAVKYNASRNEIGLFDPSVSSGANSKVLFNYDSANGKWTRSSLAGGGVGPSRNAGTATELQPLNPDGSKYSIDPDALEFKYDHSNGFLRRNRKKLIAGGVAGGGLLLATGISFGVYYGTRRGENVARIGSNGTLYLNADLKASDGLYRIGKLDDEFDLPTATTFVLNDAPAGFEIDSQTKELTFKGDASSIPSAGVTLRIVARRPDGSVITYSQRVKPDHPPTFGQSTELSVSFEASDFTAGVDTVAVGTYAASDEDTGDTVILSLKNNDENLFTIANGRLLFHGTVADLATAKQVTIVASSSANGVNKLGKEITVTVSLASTDLPTFAYNVAGTIPYDPQAVSSDGGDVILAYGVGATIAHDSVPENPSYAISVKLANGQYADPSLFRIVDNNLVYTGTEPLPAVIDNIEIIAINKNRNTNEFSTASNRLILEFTPNFQTSWADGGTIDTVFVNTETSANDEVQTIGYFGANKGNSELAYAIYATDANGTDIAPPNSFIMNYDTGVLTYTGNGSDLTDGMQLKVRAYSTLTEYVERIITIRKQSLTGTLAENAATGTTVFDASTITLPTSRVEVPTGTDVKYEIVYPTNGSYQIDEDTGIITNSRVFDYETEKTGSITVRITRGDEAYVVPVKVNISNNPAEPLSLSIPAATKKYLDFSQTAGSSTANPYLIQKGIYAQNPETGSLSADIGQDPNGENAYDSSIVFEITGELTNGTTVRLPDFSINGLGMLIYTGTNAIRSDLKKILITAKIRKSDGTFAQSSTASKIELANDDAPTFAASTPSSVTIKTDASWNGVRQTLGNARASDTDLVAGTQLQYRIESDFPGLGVTTAGQIYYEGDPTLLPDNLEFSLIVTDGANNTRKTITVTKNTAAKNSNVTAATTSVAYTADGDQQLFISNGAAAGTNIYTGDSKNRKQSVTFDASAQYTVEGSSPFAYDSATRQLKIKTGRTINYDTKSSYEVTIAKTLNGVTTRETITINVEKPAAFATTYNAYNGVKFVNNNRITVTDDAAVGDAIGRYNAVELGSPSTVRYSLSGTDAEYFDITQDGILILKNVIPANKHGTTLSLNVKAQTGTGAEASFAVSALVSTTGGDFYSNMWSRAMDLHTYRFSLAKTRAGQMAALFGEEAKLIKDFYLDPTQLAQDLLMIGRSYESKNSFTVDVVDNKRVDALDLAMLQAGRALPALDSEVQARITNMIAQAFATDAAFRTRFYNKFQPSGTSPTGRHLLSVPGEEEESTTTALSTGVKSLQEQLEALMPTYPEGVRLHDHEIWSPDQATGLLTSVRFQQSRQYDLDDLIEVLPGPVARAVELARRARLSGISAEFGAKFSVLISQPYQATNNKGEAVIRRDMRLGFNTDAGTAHLSWGQDRHGRSLLTTGSFFPYIGRYSSVAWTYDTKLDKPVGSMTLLQDFTDEAVWRTVTDEETVHNWEQMQIQNSYYLEPFYIAVNTGRIVNELGYQLGRWILPDNWINNNALQLAGEGVEGALETVDTQFLPWMWWSYSYDVYKDGDINNLNVAPVAFEPIDTVLHLVLASYLTGVYTRSLQQRGHATDVAIPLGLGLAGLTATSVSAALNYIYALLNNHFGDGGARLIVNTNFLLGYADLKIRNLSQSLYGIWDWLKRAVSPVIDQLRSVIDRLRGAFGANVPHPGNDIELGNLGGGGDGGDGGGGGNNQPPDPDQLIPPGSITPQRQGTGNGWITRKKDVQATDRTPAARRNVQNARTQVLNAQAAMRTAQTNYDNAVEAQARGRAFRRAVSETQSLFDQRTALETDTPRLSAAFDAAIRARDTAQTEFEDAYSEFVEAETARSIANDEYDVAERDLDIATDALNAAVARQGVLQRESNQLLTEVITENTNVSRLIDTRDAAQQALDSAGPDADIPALTQARNIAQSNLRDAVRNRDDKNSMLNAKRDELSALNISQLRQAKTDAETAKTSRQATKTSATAAKTAAQTNLEAKRRALRDARVEVQDAGSDLEQIAPQIAALSRQINELLAIYGFSLSEIQGNVSPSPFPTSFVQSQYTINSVTGDGDCAWASVARHLRDEGGTSTALQLRQLVAARLRANQSALLANPQFTDVLAGAAPEGTDDPFAALLTLVETSGAWVGSQGDLVVPLIAAVLGRDISIYQRSSGGGVSHYQTINWSGLFNGILAPQTATDQAPITILYNGVNHYDHIEISASASIPAQNILDTAFENAAASLVTARANLHGAENRYDIAYSAYRNITGQEGPRPPADGGGEFDEGYNFTNQTQLMQEWAANRFGFDLPPNRNWFAAPIRARPEVNGPNTIALHYFQGRTAIKSNDWYLLRDDNNYSPQFVDPDNLNTPKPDAEVLEVPEGAIASTSSPTIVTRIAARDPDDAETGKTTNLRYFVYEPASSATPYENRSLSTNFRVKDGNLELIANASTLSEGSWVFVRIFDGRYWTEKGFKVSVKPSASLATSTAVDGSITTKAKDGTVTETVSIPSTQTAPATRQTTTATDGTITTTTTRGKIVTTTPSSGSSTTTASDGTTTTTTTDGTTIVTAPDGTTTVTLPDGRTTVTNPNGVTTVTPSGGTASTVQPLYDSILTGDDASSNGVLTTVSGENNLVRIDSSAIKWVVSGTEGTDSYAIDPGALDENDETERRDLSLNGVKSGSKIFISNQYNIIDQHVRSIDGGTRNFHTISLRLPGDDTVLILAFYAPLDWEAITQIVRGEPTV